MTLLLLPSSAGATLGPDEDESPTVEVPWPRARARRRGVEGRRPPRIVVTVTEGQTLSEIAAAHGVSTSRLAQENEIDRDAPVRVGQRLRIPRARHATKPPPPPCRNPSVSFLRVASNEDASIVLTRCNGRADPDGRAALSKLARSLRADEARELHPRLLQMLQEVADHWRGRRLLVISGYRRGSPGHESNHTRGRAMDFRVEGVSNAALRDFCRRFDAAGVGFYPNSVFVHLDVRDEGRAFWVDYSAPGEPARYGPWPPARAEAGRSARAAAAVVHDALDAVHGAP